MKIDLNDDMICKAVAERVITSMDLASAIVEAQEVAVRFVRYSMAQHLAQVLATAEGTHSYHQDYALRVAGLAAMLSGADPPHRTPEPAVPGDVDQEE